MGGQRKLKNRLLKAPSFSTEQKEEDCRGSSIEVRVLWKRSIFGAVYTYRIEFLRGLLRCIALPIQQLNDGCTILSQANASAHQQSKTEL